MLSVYALMIGVLEHHEEAVKLDECHRGLCTPLVIVDGPEEHQNLTL